MTYKVTPAFIIVLHCTVSGVLGSVLTWRSAAVQMQVVVKDNFRFQGSDVYHSQDPQQHCNVTKITRDRIYVRITRQQ